MDLNDPFWVKIYLGGPKNTYEQFEELKGKWIQDTKFESNPEFIYGNENYKNIIELGKKVVPILLEDLLYNDTDWIFALQEIVKTDPVNKDHQGVFELMKNDWIDWANSHK